MFIDKLIRPLGVNLGCGKWRSFRWHGIDVQHKPGSERLDETSLLPFENDSLDYVFSSHFFEHVNDLVVQSLLAESFRVLRPQGVVRISVPDFSLTLEKYFLHDDSFFDNEWGQKERYENWLMHGVSPVIENKLMFAFANYDNISDGGVFPPWKVNPSYYCGPPKVDVELIKSATQMGVVGFGAWAVSKLPGPDQVNSYGHLNCFTFEKLSCLLAEAGFISIERSGFRMSRAVAMRGRKFDNRPLLSMFVEAQKPCAVD